MQTHKNSSSESTRVFATLPFSAITKTVSILVFVILGWDFRRSYPNLHPLRNLCVSQRLLRNSSLCASLCALCLRGEDGQATLTTKTQRTQRKHREEIVKCGFHPIGNYVLRFLEGDFFDAETFYRRSLCQLQTS